jgi:RNA polymerase sigma-70 factor (ECF subfamily)
MFTVIAVTDALLLAVDTEDVNFESLVNQHKDAVYRQMIRVCGNRDDAEDVLIEALFKAYRNLDQLHDAVAFRAWLATIASRVCWQLRKKEALQPLLQLSALEDEGRELAAPQPPVDAQVELTQMKSFLREAIASLPDAFRLVYEMRDLQGLTGDEVASRLKISRAAMKSRLHRARAMVRHHLDAALTRSTS